MKHILITVVLLFCSTANAAYIVESSPGVVTGIGNLDIGGTLYNVDFEAVGDVFSTFGGEEHFWSDNISGAYDDAYTAILAVNAVLNAAGYGSGSLNNGHPPGGNGAGAAYLIWSINPLGNGQAGVGAYFGSDWIYGGGWGPGYTEDGDIAGTAWSVAEVPIPAAAWLFGSALLTLAGIKRRKA